MPKKIVFMGTPEFSIQTLEVLIKSSFEILCVYTQPPKESFRGKKINRTPIHKAAENLNLKVRTPKSLSEKNEYEYFKSLKADIVIVVAYGNIIPENFLKLSKYGFINIHASLLPKWRGAAPIQRSIMNLDSETGISIMKIEEKLDTGPYMRQVRVNIERQTNTEILSNQLSKIGADNIIECLNLITKEEAIFTDQDHSKATYAKKISKNDSKIMWNDEAENILAKINALNPRPGAWFEYEGSRYKVWKAEVIKGSKNIPGLVIDEKLTIACKKDSIKIVEIQKEGKNKLKLNEFLAGTRVQKNKILSS